MPIEAGISAPDFELLDENRDMANLLLNHQNFVQCGHCGCCECSVTIFGRHGSRFIAKNP